MRAFPVRSCQVTASSFGNGLVRHSPFLQRLLSRGEQHSCHGTLRARIAQPDGDNPSSWDSRPRPTPEEVEHTQVEVIENVPFQVISTVSVGDFTVIERGASATGRAFITSPDGFIRKAQIYLVLDSTTAVTGTEIPLGGILNEMGGAFGASLEGYLGGEGGHAAVGDGTELEAFVATDVSLSTSKLRAFVNERRRISAQAFADQRFRMRLNIYVLPIDGTARIQVSLDGRKIGKVGPGERLTLLPTSGKHIIAVDDDKLALELTANGQYYVRVCETGRWPRVKAHLKLVPLDQGQDEITDLVGVPADQH